MPTKFDELTIKATGKYEKIKFNNVVLISEENTSDNKCEICYFYGKNSACSIMPCVGVIYALETK